MKPRPFPRSTRKGPQVLEKSGGLNQAIKRNAERFPEDFAFRLTAEEKTELVTICDRFARLKHSENWVAVESSIW